MQEEISLLDNSQTLIGVLSTLLVLCLFIGESGNFIFMLLKDMKSVFDNIINEKVTKLGQQIKQKIDKHENLSDLDFFEKVSQHDRAQDFLRTRMALGAIPGNAKVKFNLIKDNFSELSEKFISNKEFARLALLMFFFSLKILVIDALLPITDYSLSVVINILVLNIALSFGVWINLYTKLCKDFKPRTPFCPTKLHYWIASILLIIVILTLIYSTYDSITKNNIIAISLYGFVLFGLMYKLFWKAPQVVDAYLFSSEFIIKHSFWFILVSLFLPCCEETRIYDDIIPLQTEAAVLFIRIFIISLLFVNLLIIPLLTSFAYHRILKRRFNNNVKKSYGDFEYRLEQEDEKLNKLISQIKEEVKRAPKAKTTSPRKKKK